MAVGAILLADDEETFRESTCRLLRREGFVCHCVKNAEEGVESLRRGQFDVLIADIRMPNNPDMRIVRETRQWNSHFPIILVTGYPTAETAIEAIELAVDAYLTKPLDIDDLISHVRKAIKGSHLRQRLAAVVERLRSVVKDLESDALGRLLPAPETNEVALPTIRTLASCLSELLILWNEPAATHDVKNLCDLLDCPQRPAHRQAILEAIEVLEKRRTTSSPSS